MRRRSTLQPARPHRFTLRCQSLAWGESPAWVAPGEASADALLAGWNERADRVMILGIGADAYAAETVNRAVGCMMAWDLKPGETRTGWLVRPYRAYADDLPALRKHDWAAEEDAALREWRRLLAKAAQVIIPDEGVEHAFRACLADLFIMREPVQGGGIAATPGTEVYRAPGTVEGALIPIALDELGMHREAERGYQRCIETQEPDGNWDDAKGWGHLMWCIAGFKAWAGMEHYRLTRDRAYLERLYPRLLASSRWQETQRARTRVLEAGRKPLTYGLMPRGMGDCGLMNDDDLYGVFLPHNIWAVYADKLAVEAAEILGRKDDLPERRRIYEAGRADLLAAMERGSIEADGYRWIPGVPGKTSGSRWGVLNALFPCGLLAPDDPLITGTIRYMESRLSPGGIPIHTGWMTDGMWVAITLDNLAEAHLVRGEGDAAARYLYATLNHGTPLLTWCEERGPEPGTSKCSGDRQHLWTPVAVVRAVRDCLVMEDGEGLHLLRGADREWLGSGRPVGIRGACTHAGPVSFSLRYDAAASRVTGEAAFASGDRPAWVAVHLRLPGGLKVVSASGGEVVPGGEAIRIAAPRGKVRIEAVVGR